ncbi:MAG: DUF4965 domain-containing protein [Prevotellaceae bacterium]|nr:DUF4965 domain-containing protein [Prevotellaceae bacterium]
MKKRLVIVLCGVFFLTRCAADGNVEARRAASLRAPAYPLVTIDPYTSAWSAGDQLYDGHVMHWTGTHFPLIGAIRVDGQVYRFMGIEHKHYETVVPTTGQMAWEGAYTFAEPPAGWQQPEFDDSAWKRGPAAFGSSIEGDVKTLWPEPANDIWLRREINLTANDITRRTLYVHYSNDDDVILYLNGVEVANVNGWGFHRVAALPEAAVRALKPGKNILAARCTNTGGLSFIDLGMDAEVPATYHLAQAAQQTVADVQATQTHYTFTCGPVELELTFTAPLLMDNLEYISRPVNYMTYRVTPTDGAAHDVAVYVEAAPTWALDNYQQPSRAEGGRSGGLAWLRTGSESQHILGKRGDDVRIDWGYFYLCGDDTPAFQYYVGDPAGLRAAFAQHTQPAAPAPGAYHHLAVVHALGQLNGATSGKIMLGYDDIFSVQYFGENLRPYWNRSGMETIASQFLKAHQDYDKLLDACNRFDAELMRSATAAGGKKYAELCALAYRQAISAHKLVQAPNGDLLWLSKENGSNGSIGTVDVTYPSAPLFLLYNHELCKGLLNHIFYYSESGRWKKPFPAHDIGSYPIANGMTYGRDMPTEEAGNMLILTAAIAKVEGHAKYAKSHWKTLTKWAEYLLKNGVDPADQLCTDDFAGHLAHNANLSIKAVLGVASYGYLAGALGEKKTAERYMNAAREMAQQWEALANAGDHYKLAFDQPDSWSQKYNLIWDKLLGFDLFPEKITRTELAWYLTHQDRYGLPLDSREHYTKTDWVMWVATLSDDKATFEQLIAPVHDYMNETIKRVPMSDWVNTDRPTHRSHIARSVVGGYFIKLLKEKL